jgi:hypothetical protein
MAGSYYSSVRENTAYAAVVLAAQLAGRVRLDAAVGLTGPVTSHEPG